jgi:hypothetical protein
MARKGSFEERARAEVERIKEERIAEEVRTKCVAFNSWVAKGGAPSEVEAAWPNLKREMLTKRTLEHDSQARQLQRTSGVSRI